MNRTASIALVVLVIISCADNNQHPKQPAAQVTNNQEENFDAFLEKFSTDSAFQRSRVRFPLIIEANDIDSEKPIISTIEADKWAFFNIKQTTADKKNIYTTRKEKDRYILNATLKIPVFLSITYLNNGKENGYWCGLWTRVLRHPIYSLKWYAINY